MRLVDVFVRVVADDGNHGICNNDGNYGNSGQEACIEKSKRRLLGRFRG